jgi:hypothetical protein
MYEQVPDEICTSSTAWVDAAIALRPQPDVVGEAPTDNPDDVSRSPRLSPICFYCFSKLRTVEEMRKENTKLLRKRKRNSLKGLKTQHTRTPRQPNNHTRSVQRDTARKTNHVKQKKKHRS